MDYVRDTLDAAHGVRARHPSEPLVLVGHSMGGLAAQKAAESLDLAALVLVSAVPPRGIPLVSGPLCGAAEACGRNAALARDRDRTGGHDGAVPQSRDPAEVASFQAQWVPASGREDAISRSAVSRSMRSALAAPCS